jgi:hypothetical protein
MSHCNSCYRPVTVCCCPTPVVPPTPVAPTCINPIVVLLDQAKDCFMDQPCQNQNCQSPVTEWMSSTILNFNGDPLLNPLLFQEYFEVTLINGLIQANQSYCCATCCEDTAYFLGGVNESTTAASDYFEAGGTVNCCANFYGTLKAQTILIDLYDLNTITPPSKCNNNFNDCINLLDLNTEDMPALANLGILETMGSLGQSEICNLINVMLSNSFTPELIQIVFEEILNKGLIVSCLNGQIFIGNASGYNDWMKIYGPNGPKK